MYSMAVSVSAVILGIMLTSDFLQTWLITDGIVSAFIVIVRLVRHHEEIIAPINDEICSKRPASLSLDMESRAIRLELEAEGISRSSSDEAAAADAIADGIAHALAENHREEEKKAADSSPSRHLLLSHHQQHFEISESMKEPTTTSRSDEPFVRASPHLLTSCGLSRVGGGEPYQTSTGKTLWGILLFVTDLLTMFRFAWTIVGTVLLVQTYKTNDVNSIFTQSLVCGYLMFTGCFFKVGQKP